VSDKLTPEQRHVCMSHIRGKDTKPEVFVRKALWKLGFRYRVNVKSLPGKPDIVFTKYKTAVFVNGCFWHGHDGCKKYQVPETNTNFWVGKIEANRSRDIKNKDCLENSGWQVVTVWECELSTKEKRTETVRKLVNCLQCQAMRKKSE